MTTDESYDLLNTILERDYYVPDVSELCIGFEYSYKTDVIEHRVIESKYDLEFTFGLHLDNNLFVKKLDVEDIESFGFELKITNCGEDTKTDLDIYNKDNMVIGSFMPNKEWTIDLFTIYFKIKNKSELNKLFKQVGIC